MKFNEKFASITNVRKRSIHPNFTFQQKKLLLDTHFLCVLVYRPFIFCFNYGRKRKKKTFISFLEFIYFYYLLLELLCHIFIIPFCKYILNFNEE